LSGETLIATLINPSSPQAQALAQMSLIILGIAALIFIIVASLVTIASYKFKERPDKPYPAKNFGNPKVEILWTLAPAVVLVLIFFFTVKTMHAVDPPPGDHEADLIIKGHQWWWEVRYPHSGVLTANEIHIQAGKKYLVRLESDDVIHDFWVPELARKIDAIPGRQNYFYLEADQPGLYKGVCAEYCGTQHAGMHILVISQSPKEFEAWEKSQLVLPPEPTGGLEARGAKIFASKTCYDCHAIAGTGATLSIGPDLTHVSTRQTLGAGVLENSRENLGRWLTNPQKFKPGSHMPNFQLSPQEVEALVAYLESLK